MLTAILTSASVSVGQKLRIFVGSKISETKWQKLNKTAAGSVSTRSASASVSASAVEGLPRCSETCAEKVLQNVTYHNNCHEKIRSFIRFCGKGKFCFGHQKFGTPTSAKMRDLCSLEKKLKSLRTRTKEPSKRPTKRSNSLGRSVSSNVDLGTATAFSPDYSSESASQSWTIEGGG